MPDETTRLHNDDEDRAEKMLGAAPLEGTPLIDDTFVAQIEDGLGMGHGAWDTIDPIKICKTVAAAVSKNSREDAIQPYIQRIEEIGGALKKTDEERERAEARISELEDAIKEFFAHDGGPGSQDYSASKVFCARRKLREMAEIRSKP